MLKKFSISHYIVHINHIANIKSHQWINFDWLIAFHFKLKYKLNQATSIEWHSLNINNE